MMIETIYIVILLYGYIVILLYYYIKASLPYNILWQKSQITI